MKARTIVGLLLTVLWLLAFSIVVFLRADTLLTLKLNELGDLLAGAAAPLALLWLIIGYAQQGEELRQNTLALRAQQVELQRQVEQTTELASQAQRQARAAEVLASASQDQAMLNRLRTVEAMDLHLDSCGGIGSPPNFEMHLKNSGSQVFDLELSCDAPASMHLPATHRLDAGALLAVTLTNATSYPIQFRIGYTNAINSKRVKRYEIPEPFHLRELRDT